MPANKKRQPWKANKRPHKHFGSSNGSAKLCEEQVRSLLERRITERWSCSELSRIFGITPNAAWKIAAGDRWAHIYSPDKLIPPKRREYLRRLSAGINSINT
ncbi:MAG: hypothetical protein ACREBC_20820 [Pyrinomonadaceae bacterium]